MTHSAKGSTQTEIQTSKTGTTAIRHETLVRMVNRYQTIIDDALTRIEGGEIDALSTAGKPYRDLLSLSKQLMETADELRRARDAREDAFDFDAARAAIRGRLDNLRAAEGAGGVSG
ncbi:MAG: hypothetical protein ACU0DW_12035 [Shimia sp.]